MTAAIDVANLTHHYAGGGREKLLVLDNLSLHIPAGQFVSIVGASGCGKTTLLDIMSGLLTLQSGSMTLAENPPVPGRKDISRMFARDSLLPWLNATKNIDFALRTRVPDKSRRRHTIQELLDAVGLNGFERTFPSQLSQGMRQRVALVRTFALPSQFVLLDEPFGALDAQTKIVLQDQLLRLWEKLASTVVLVTHDLGEAVALSDRVIVMSSRPGRVVADVAIDLPRPRSVRQLQKDREYHDLYAHLWEQLEQTGTAKVAS